MASENGWLDKMEVNFERKEQEFYKKIISEYLKFGSVDRVFQENGFDLPISFASFHRLLDSWGIVKTAGPNSAFSEAISFLLRLCDERVPMERLYKRMPPNFQISMQTIHRILSYVRRGITRRVGTALIITPNDSPDLVLIGNDVSTPRLDVGKPYGSVSLPMGYSKKSEPVEDSILRVLQQEVFTDLAVEKNLPEVFLRSEAPIAFVDIADVRVSVYHLSLPEGLVNENAFSSYKLIDHRFLSAAYLHTCDPRAENLRSGVSEAIDVYLNNSPVPQFTTSLLNQELVALAYEVT